MSVLPEKKKTSYLELHKLVSPIFLTSSEKKNMINFCSFAPPPLHNSCLKNYFFAIFIFFKYSISVSRYMVWDFKITFWSDFMACVVIGIKNKTSVQVNALSLTKIP